nr:transglycosylase domain-containing protein [Deinobacterium chartae]
MAACIISGAVLSTFALKWGRDIPDFRELDNLTLGSTTRVYARDRSLIGILAPTMPGGGRINRTLVTLDEVSPYMVAAVVTSEDRRFFEHYGLDPQGVSRGLIRTFNGERVEGGSTLTNQLIKNTLLQDRYEGARTPERKIKEWILSVQAERAFTKEEVLRNYLNVVYWGRGGALDIIGVHAAARSYLGKDPKDLTLAESVYLTILLPKPGRYFDYAAYRPLMRSLLTRMVEDNWITPAQANEAWREKLAPRGWKVAYDDQGNLKGAKLVNPNAKNVAGVVTERAPHFMQQVERELIARFGRERVFGSGGLTVYTTLDPKAQRAAEQASRDAVIPSGATLGMALLDPQNGEVLAMVGQKLHGNRPPAEWNNAVQGARQVGSSIKPLLYTTAVDLGYGQDHTEPDQPVSFPCVGCPGGVWQPGNFEGRVSGRNVTLRYALDNSLNLPTVRLADRIGLPAFTTKLRQLGLPVPERPNLTLSIGTLETSPLKMAAAYAPFANGGLYYEPSYLRRVETASGQVLYDSSRDRPKPRRVWSPQVAYVGMDMLLGVVNDLGQTEGGLAWRARIPGRQVGGKTGTTNDVKDLWFVGLTPQAVGAVWVGKQAGGVMPRNAYSGTINPPIWKQMVEGALAGKPPARFEPPEGVGFKQLGAVRAAYVIKKTENAPTTPHVAKDTRPRYTWVKSLPEDPATMIVALDRQTLLLADEFTPADRIVRRRIRVQDLPLYQPQPRQGSVSTPVTAGTAQ